MVFTRLSRQVAADRRLSSPQLHSLSSHLVPPTYLHTAPHAPGLTDRHAQTNPNRPPNNPRSLPPPNNPNPHKPRNIPSLSNPYPSETPTPYPIYHSLHLNQPTTSHPEPATCAQPQTKRPPPHPPRFRRTHLRNARDPTYFGT